jgi:uncharacterized damage-inducible protein DinB
MKLNESLLTELGMEASTTRKMLERIPEPSLGWKPHEKSRTLGELGGHIARIPAFFIASLHQSAFDRTTYEPGDAGSPAAIVAEFDRNIADARQVLQRLSENDMMSAWRYLVGGAVIFELPRIAVIRGMGINHLIHHRGQLSVYLRLLNVALPPVYGPTADETG